MFKAYFISLFLILILFSCKKDPKIQHEVLNPTIVSYNNYTKYAVGNYWIYQRFAVDTDGITTPTNIIDSCYISKDTIINGNTYFKMHRPNTWGSSISFTRDSSNFIINQYGQKFSLSNFSTIYFSGYSTASSTDTIALVEGKMANKDSLLSTPAGNFTTINARGIHYIYPMWHHFNSKFRYSNRCYAENIGIVVETLNIIYTWPISYERKLLRYHVN